METVNLEQRDDTAWCKKCNTSKDSVKHQKHLQSKKDYNQSVNGRNSHKKYKQSEKGKTARKIAENKRAHLLSNAGLCIRHSKIKAIIRGKCEACWWESQAGRNLGSKFLSGQLKEYFETVQDTRCIYSGIELKVPDLNLDHFISLSRGGNKCLENVGATTKVINRLKGSLNYDEFLWVCKLRWETHQAGATDESSLLMIQIWEYQLSKPTNRPTLFKSLSWLPG